MSAYILRGDAGTLPLPDGCVDLIVTSPPYYALRSYTDGGVHYPGQIGSEPTPAEYIAALVDCTREWMRVLRPGGSMFVDLGDKYGRSGGIDRKERGSHFGDPGGRAAPRRPQRSPEGFRDKSLLLLPERYRIAAVDRLGLIARAVIVWAKPNGLPESVTDRVRRCHEDWVHLTKQPRYYSAVDEIREGYSEISAARHPVGSINGSKVGATQNTTTTLTGMRQLPNPLGKLPGSVWTIPTEPLQVPAHLGIDHFAAFPTEWPRRLILGWSPPGICADCGEGRRPASVGENVPTQRTHNGYVCACPEPTAPTRPSVVLDPFGGTGTTALVAKALGRHGISVDRSADYCRLARWRCNDPRQVAKAMHVPKPDPVTESQLAFDLGVV